MEPEYPHDPSAASAPPTRPGPLPAPPRTSKWPTILGVIAIVLGVLGVLGGVWGFVAPAVMPHIMPDIPSEVAAELERTKGWTMISSALTLALALLLAVSGVGLTNRRLWSVSVARLWAVLKMLLVVVGVGMAWQIQSVSFRANPGVPPGGTGFTTSIQIMSLVFGLVWGWALPVFMLIWLSRPRIKAETEAWN